MDSAKTERWIIPFKKFGRLRVKITNELILMMRDISEHVKLHYLLTIYYLKKKEVSYRGLDGHLNFSRQTSLKHFTYLVRGGATDLLLGRR